MHGRLLTASGRPWWRPRHGRRAYESAAVLASMVCLTAVLAPPPATSSDAAVTVTSPGPRVQPLGPADSQLLVLLGERVTAVETATATLVGGPLEDTTTAASRASSHVEGAAATTVAPGVALEALPARVLDARQEVTGGDVTTAERAVADVETDVLLVALQLGDQAAQNASLTRLFVADAPEVAALDAAVGATHAAAEVRDVVAAATSAVQARDAASAVTVAAQQAALAGDAEAQAALEQAQKRAQQQARSTKGYTNGSIPLKVLCAVPFAPSQHLRCDAMEALVRMNDAYRADVGRDLSINGSYRALEDQITTRAAKGTMAAVPGTSNHGWGLAIDLNQTNSYRSATYVWLKANATRFGWHHPVYMDEGGAGPHEPWHWEFGTTDGVVTGTPVRVAEDPPTSAPAGPTPPPAEQPAPAPVPGSVPNPVPNPAPNPVPAPVPAPTAQPPASPSPTRSPAPTPPAGAGTSSGTSSSTD